MINKWSEGVNRTCTLVKEIQKGQSCKMVVLEVKDEFGITLFYQTSKVHVCFSERGINNVEMCEPYLARPVFTDKDEAIKHCKNITKKEDDQIKEADKHA